MKKTPVKVPRFDSTKADAFAGRMAEALNHGMLCLMASIGHRTGLFDALRDAPPSTPDDIAAGTGLNERYVREWVGAMVAAGLLEASPDGRRFTLPPEHAASLSRSAGPGNMAVYMQYVGLAAGVEDDIVACFRRGGGVPYEKFPRFHEVQAEDSGNVIVPSLETHILPLVPGLIARLESGIRVLDAGCGRGRALNRMASLFPKSRFTGIDLSEPAIASARQEAAAQNLKNAEFAASDLTDFDAKAPRGAYDFVTTFDAIHDQVRPLHVLKGIHRALKADGVYLMQDVKGSSHIAKNVDHPFGTFLYTISCMHCMTVSLAAGGEGLGAMWGEEKTREYLKQAGFRSVVKHELAHDLVNNWYVVRK